jgi:hypothetical protein
LLSSGSLPCSIIPFVYAVISSLNFSSTLKTEVANYFETFSATKVLPITSQIRITLKSFLIIPFNLESYQYNQQIVYRLMLWHVEECSVALLSS